MKNIILITALSCTIVGFSQENTNTRMANKRVIEAETASPQHIEQGQIENNSRMMLNRHIIHSEENTPMVEENTPIRKEEKAILLNKREINNSVERE